MANMEHYKASIKFDISYEPPQKFFFRQREFHILSQPISKFISTYTHVRCWEGLNRTISGEEIGVISNVLRATASCRRNLAFSTTFTRNQSIFTKYREPPNGFQFSEKVSYWVCCHPRTIQYYFDMAYYLTVLVIILLSLLRSFIVLFFLLVRKV